MLGCGCRVMWFLYLLIVLLQSELVNTLALQVKEKDEELKILIGRLSANRDEIVRLNAALSKAQQESVPHDVVTSRDQQITRLREQVQQLLKQERMKQEEVSRCRAQVVSLSTELAVERQMVQEARQQLAQERAIQKQSSASSSQVSSPRATPSSLYQQFDKPSNITGHESHEK